MHLYDTFNSTLIWYPETMWLFCRFFAQWKKHHPHDKDFFIHWGTLYLSVCSQCMKTRQLPWAHTVGCCYLNCNNSQSSFPFSYLVYFVFDITNKMTSWLVIVKVTARTYIIWSLPGNNIFAHKDIFYLLQIEFLSSPVIIPRTVWIANKDHLFWLSWLRNAIWFEIQI